VTTARKLAYVAVAVVLLFAAPTGLAFLLWSSGGEAPATPRGSVIQQPAVPPLRETEVRVVAPYTYGDKLSPELRVKRRASGECFGSSAAALRPDAFRCSVESEIIDPCFSGGPLGQVACPDAPWSRQVTLITLNQALRDPFDTDLDPAAKPWGLELEDGRRCELLLGATSTIAGERVNYACGNDLYLVGEPNRSTRVWRIFLHEPKVLTQVRVRTAWR
jgi:hypothetical protein